MTLHCQLRSSHGQLRSSHSQLRSTHLLFYLCVKFRFKTGNGYLLDWCTKVTHNSLELLVITAFGESFQGCASLRDGGVQLATDC